MMRELFSISDTGIWIKLEDDEISIGYGLISKHFSEKFNNLKEYLELFFNLLTKRKRVIQYFKGKFHYKNKLEIEIINSKYEKIGVSMNWLFPYW